jgi:hypothetical protein
MPTAGSTTSPAATSTAASTAGVSPSARATAGAPVRIPLSGAAPAAIVLDGETAWVLTGEGGTLIEVDLAAAREVRAIEVGFGATHLAAAADGVMAVGRFDDSGSGAYCLLVDVAAGTVRPVETGELGALTAGSDGDVWALEKAGQLVRVDVGTAKVTGRTAAQVGENVHVEVQWGAGTAWVGSDGLPVVRFAPDNLGGPRTIEVDTGIPFRFEGGLMWGAGPTQLWAIDPATNQVKRRIPLANLIEILALDVDSAGGEAWLAVRHPGYVGAVLRLDLESGLVVEEHAVELPAAVRIGPDRVWVASYLSDELLGFER